MRCALEGLLRQPLNLVKIVRVLTFQDTNQKRAIIRNPFLIRAASAR
jgi:hypothetical protein